MNHIITNSKDFLFASTVEDISRQLKITTPTVRMTLRALETLGRIVRVDEDLNLNAKGEQIREWSVVG